MAEYVTLIEAAELEGVKYKTMAQRLSRNPDKFDTKTEKSETGGKDAVLVAVASLSKKARNAWKGNLSGSSPQANYLGLIHALSLSSSVPVLEPFHSSLDVYLPVLVYDFVNYFESIFKLPSEVCQCFRIHA